MATSAETRKAFVFTLKEGAAQVTAVKVALDAVVTDLDDTSTDAEIVAAITEWDRIRQGYTDYGRVQLPTLAILQADMQADIIAAAAP
jgi:hypothetical protein